MFPAEAFRDTLLKAVALFREHGIGFHLTGGITSIFYGEPRLTQDIDIVVDNEATTRGLESFLRSLRSSEFLFDDESVRRAVADRGMFQLLDTEESLKLDVYPRELIPGELERSVMVELFEGERLPIVSRADAAASKLVWVDKGSHKSRRDLRQIFRAAGDGDRHAIRALARRLDLEPLLDQVLAETDVVS